MSETTDPLSTPPPEPDPPPPAPPQPEQAPLPEAAQPPIPDDAAPIAPRWVKPAMDRLTREKHEARRELELAQQTVLERDREIAVYKSVAEGRGTPAELPPRAPAPPSGPSVEEAAEQLVSNRALEAKRLALISTGTKELGEAAWLEKTNIVGQLGATESPAFMRAIVSVPDGHRVVAALADNPERVVALLGMDPVEMAAEMGRMAGELAAPKPRTISNAPRPVAPINGRPQPEPNVYDTKSMSMSEYVALRSKTAPRSLGGQGKRV